MQEKLYSLISMLLPLSLCVSKSDVFVVLGYLLSCLYLRLR
uniref:Uncharacterized protein n=1 Tax=Rhizophora mucronata TaxID=61149 RepID=A0A2P2NT27_RHIMU